MLLCKVYRYGIIFTTAAHHKTDDEILQIEMFIPIFVLSHISFSNYVKAVWEVVIARGVHWIKIYIQKISSANED